LRSGRNRPEQNPAQEKRGKAVIDANGAFLEGVRLYPLSHGRSLTAAYADLLSLSLT
jgi:hypothetical protein